MAKDHSYFFSTDAGQTTIKATSITAAIKKFVRGDKMLAGVKTLSDLKARVRAIGDGATLYIVEDGSNVLARIK
jgi:hypothetical protein